MAKKSPPQDEWVLTHFCATNWEGLQFDDWMPVGTRYLLFGKNNSGKSSFVRLLRLVGLLTLPIPWRVFDETYVEGGLHNSGIAKGAPEKGPRPYALLRDPMGLAEGSKVLKKVAEPGFLRNKNAERFLEKHEADITEAAEDLKIHSFNASSFIVFLRLSNETSGRIIVLSLPIHDTLDYVSSKRRFCVSKRLSAYETSEQGDHGIERLPFSKSDLGWEEIELLRSLTPLRRAKALMRQLVKSTRIGIKNFQKEDLSVKFENIRTEAIAVIESVAPPLSLKGKVSSGKPEDFLSGFKRIKLKAFDPRSRYRNFVPDLSPDSQSRPDSSPEAASEPEWVSYRAFQLVAYSFRVIQEDLHKDTVTHYPLSKNGGLRLVSCQSAGDLTATIALWNEDFWLPIFLQPFETARDFDPEEEYEPAEDDSMRYQPFRIDRPFAALGKGVTWVVSNLIRIVYGKEKEWNFEHIENFLHPSLAADFFQDIVELTPFSVFETHEQALLLRAQWMVAHDRIPTANIQTLIFEAGKAIKRAAIKPNGELSIRFPDGYAELLYDLDPGRKAR